MFVVVEVDFYMTENEVGNVMFAKMKGGNKKMEECFECKKRTDKGETIGIYEGRDEFFCSECAKRLFM